MNPLPFLARCGLGAAVVLLTVSCSGPRPSDRSAAPATYYAGPSADAIVSGGGGAESGEPGWPRQVVTGTTTNLLYEPQVDSWNGQKLVARQAVAVQMAGQAQPTYGVVDLQAITIVDKAKRQVNLENIQVLGGDFPSARSESAAYLQQLRQHFPKELPGLSLDRLEASFVPPPPAPAATSALNNQPPRFFVSKQPAILVSIDGPPVFRPVAGTSLERVLNSRALILRDPAGKVYVHFLNGYLQAPSLDGPWVVAPEPPPGAAQAEQQAEAAPTPVDLLDGRSGSETNAPPALSSSTAPTVYVSTKPAELLVFEGEPNFVPIPGTHLLYAANTTANVFKSTGSQQTYVLSSGRWFQGPSLSGPWKYLPADRLPQDFANIPDNSPKENVKASVPGTVQATEALIANSIPQGDKVPRSTPMQPARIDGPPRLEPINGTPLSFVVNSGTPIIKVDDHSWYACQNGVWFAATSVNGPWTVAASVPAVIYTIPPSSPLHYLTYVQVYGATPEEVYEGYTPGYWGTEVEDGVVVYGTGYYYPPWVGDYWFGWPCTWGFGWGPCWTPWDDWCFDFGFGWGCGYGRFGWWGCHPLHPWWGPFHGRWHGGGLVAGRRGESASTAGNIYARAASTRPLPAATPGSRTAPAGMYGRAYNSRTGDLAAGQRAGLRNVYSSMAAGPHANSASARYSGGFANNWRSPRAASAPLVPRSGYSGYGGAGFRGYGGAGSYGHQWGGGYRGGYGSGYSHGYGGGYSHGYGGGYSHGGFSGGGGHSGGGFGGGGHGGGGGGGGGGRGHR